MGCIACRKQGFQRPAEIHHLVEGYRLGHDATIPLCEWHHRGVPPMMSMTKAHARKLLGPSLEESKRQFVAEYGSEKELLDEVNEWL
jgi:hypothetical protein